MSNSKQGDGLEEKRFSVNPSECFKVTEDPKWIDINELKSRSFLKKIRTENGPTPIERSILKDK